MPAAPPPAMPRAARVILWTDSIGGLVVGALVVALHGPIAQLHGLSTSLVIALGSANLVYGTYSGTLARGATRGHAPSRRAVDILVAANLAWTVVCVVLAAWTWRAASVFGTAHLVGEGAYVGALALVERARVRPHARAS